MLMKLAGRRQKLTGFREVRQSTFRPHRTPAHIRVRHTHPALLANVGADPVTRPQLVSLNLVLIAELEEREVSIVPHGQTPFAIIDPEPPRHIPGEHGSEHREVLFNFARSTGGGK